MQRGCRREDSEVGVWCVRGLGGNQSTDGGPDEGTRGLSFREWTGARS